MHGRFEIFEVPKLFFIHYTKNLFLYLPKNYFEKYGKLKIENRSGIS